jgi:hypothetical protein
VHPHNFLVGCASGTIGFAIAYAVAVATGSERVWLFWPSVAGVYFLFCWFGFFKREKGLERRTLLGGCTPMEGIGVYILDKPISEFQASELSPFSEFDYDHLLKTYGIRRLFPDEVFYTAANKAFLGYEATEAVVAALNGLIYKVYFNFTDSSARDGREFEEKVLAYAQNRFGKPTEVRDLPNGMKITIWNRDFGNVIIETDDMHSALVFTSRSLNESGSLKEPEEFRYLRYSEALRRTKPTAPIVTASLLIMAYMLGTHGWWWIVIIWVSIMTGSAVMVFVRIIIRKRFGYSSNMSDKDWMPM